MKILLVHPKDRAESGPWQDTQWNWIVDLGWAGRSAYAELGERLQCHAFSIRDVLDHGRHLQRLREVWQPGAGQLVDDEGIDWWDVFQPMPFARIEEVLLVSSLASQIPDDAEVAATRPHFLVRALSALRKRDVSIFYKENTSVFSRLGRLAATFHPVELVSIALDKWDADYRFRRRISPATKASAEPVVLLPSGYVNVSRAQVAYARMLPQQRFLLIVTRRSGGLLDLPSNVELRSLAAYAPRPFRPATEKEQQALAHKWRGLQEQLSESSGEFRLARELGVFENFPNFLRTGLRVRDAWRAVLSREPIQAVLSADENNPFTRLPTLLANSRGVRTVVCEHGALNMGFALRPAASSICLARGEMGRDYWKEFCGMRHGQMLVGSPAASPLTPRTAGQSRDWMVFFSEAYELNSGRTESLYAELLPKLCSLARQTQRRVVIKLHPFESLRSRTRLVDQLLLPDQRSLVTLREGPLTPDLFERAWFSLTVESSVAVECALQGVPCFLCGWFDCSWYEYGTQFERFSAARTLNSPAAILEIPKLLEGPATTPATVERLVSEIRPDQLREVLGKN